MRLVNGYLSLFISQYRSRRCEGPRSDRLRRGILPLVSTMVLPLALLAFWVPQTSADVLYSYDYAGRLNQATDQNGYESTYHYDYSGNMTSVSGNAPAAEIQVWLLSPSSSTVGAQVTISGANFSSTPSADSVEFGGVSASVLSASATQLIVTVPSGAQSGPVTVTTSAGTAQSPGPFTVQ